MHEELIEAVRKKSVLYYIKDPEYIKSKLKDEIWNKIAMNFNLIHGKYIKI